MSTTRKPTAQNTTAQSTAAQNLKAGNVRAQAALEVADWRRRVFALYEAVRERSIQDPPGAHAHWITERNGLFASHPATPLLAEDRAEFAGLPVTAYDPGWRLELQVDAAEPRRMNVETGTDGVVPFDLIGTVTVPHPGGTDAGTLDVWRLASYGGGIFIPIKDALAGKPDGTYGGGRYLLDTIKGADLGQGSAAGSIILDFNFAYNPSCAYDPAWACPLAQAGNTLAFEIPVGERYP
jgi:uncharacterized protein (DUF1684 family)